MNRCNAHLIILPADRNLNLHSQPRKWSPLRTLPIRGNSVLASCCQLYSEHCHGEQWAERETADVVMRQILHSTNPSPLTDRNPKKVYTVATSHPKVVTGKNLPGDRERMARIVTIAHSDNRHNGTSYAGKCCVGSLFHVKIHREAQWRHKETCINQNSREPAQGNATKQSEVPQEQCLLKGNRVTL